MLVRFTRRTSSVPLFPPRRVLGNVAHSVGALKMNIGSGLLTILELDCSRMRTKSCGAAQAGSNTWLWSALTANCSPIFETLDGGDTWPRE